MLRHLLQGLVARPEVAGGAVVSSDGLVIDQLLDPGVDGDALAALAIAIGRNGRELGQAVQLGQLGPMVFDFDGGSALVGQLRDGACVILLARPGHDLGDVLYFLRRQRDSIAAQL